MVLTMKQNKVSGIYKITNTITGDFYIGSSNNVKQRWANHKSPSTWAKRPGMKLYQAFIKYGLVNFTFEIFELVEENTLLKEKEQYYIEQLKPSYNIIRAKGPDDRRQYMKEYHNAHRNENLDRMKKYHNAHRIEINSYYQRLCLYEGKIFTLNVLKNKLSKLGFSHPVQEAKKYLLNE